MKNAIVTLVLGVMLATQARAQEDSQVLCTENYLTVVAIAEPLEEWQTWSIKKADVLKVVTQPAWVTARFYVESMSANDPGFWHVVTKDKWNDLIRCLG